jgi:hypothetical protein
MVKNGEFQIWSLQISCVQRMLARNCVLVFMVKSLYLYSRKYECWSWKLEFRGQLEICKLQIWSSPFLTTYGYDWPLILTQYLIHS